MYLDVDAALCQLALQEPGRRAPADHDALVARMAVVEDPNGMRAELVCLVRGTEDETDLPLLAEAQDEPGPTPKWSASHTSLWVPLGLDPPRCSSVAPWQQLET